MSDEAQEELSDLVRELIYDNGGKIIKQEKWGKKRLAYTIKHLNEGFYYYFLYGGDKVDVDVLERRLKLNEDCIRFMTVRLDKELKGKKHKIFTQEELRLALQMESSNRSQIKMVDKEAEEAAAKEAEKAAKAEEAKPVVEEAKVEEKVDAAPEAPAVEEKPAEAPAEVAETENKTEEEK